MTDRPARAWSGRLDLLAIARAAAGLIERFAIPLYAAVIAIFLLLFVAAAGLFTVEADEAWILLSTMNAFGVPLASTDAIASPTLTSGGVHLLIHGTLAWFTSSMFAHRLVSLLCAGLLLATVYWALRRMGRPVAAALAGTALFAAVPGMLFQAGLATAEIIATLLLLWACLHWVLRGQWSYSGALLSGLLFGLSCATRVNCVIALPAILIASLLAGADWRRRVPRALLAIGVAGVTLGLALAAYYFAARANNGLEAQHFFVISSGVTGAKSPTHLLWAFVIGDRIMPAWLIAVICAAYLVSTAEGTDRAPRLEPSALSAILLLIGLAGLAAWIAKAPIPHVRYLWPAVPCLWLVGTILITQPWVAKRRGYAALGFHALILTACGARLASDSLAVANGESLTLVYQANGMSPFRLPRGSFHAAHDQRELAAFVASRPDDARFYSFIPPTAYPVTLLSRRAVADVRRMGPSGRRYLILNPADISVWHPDAAFVQWLRASTTPEFVSGEFAAFRVRDGAPLPPDARLTRVGNNDILDPPAG